MFNNYDYLFKLAIVGDSGIGKTALLIRYVDEIFTPKHISTIGVDFKIKTINFNDKRIKFQIWDTAGQERFRNIVSSYYRGIHGIIIVYDVTNKTSLQNVHDWLREVNSFSKENIPIILVGNKSDLCDDKEVEAKQVEEIVEKYGLEHFETSALQNKGIGRVFDCMAKSCMKDYKTLELRKTNISSTNHGTGTSISLDKTIPTFFGFKYNPPKFKCW